MGAHFSKKRMTKEPPPAEWRIGGTGNRSCNMFHPKYDAMPPNDVLEVTKRVGVGTSSTVSLLLVDACYQ